MEANPLELTDAQLVQATLRGNHTAFDDLVSRYRSRTFYLALSKVRSREAALDIAQEAFVRAYMSLGTLNEPERFAAWLGSIISHACGTYLRKARETPVPAETIEMLSASQTRENQSDLDAALARETIDQLPNGTRSAAILYFVEEMKQAEIAEFLGISLAAVKSRIRDARASLQKEMIYMVKQTAKKEEPGDEFEKSLKHRLELARWYQEFSELIDAGVTLVRSLFMLSEGNYSQPIKDAGTKVRLAVESGSTLTDALREAPVLRTPESVGLVRAGEIGGTIEFGLRSLVRCIEARSLQKDIELYTWCRTLGEILSAGVGIIHAFECAVEFSVSSELKQATRDMIKAIYDCKPKDCDARIATPLSHTASLYPDLFPPMIRLVLHVSEYNASLDPALKWLADDLALDMAKRLGPAGLLVKQSIPGGEFLDTDITRSYLKHESPVMRGAAATLLARIGAQNAGVEVAELISDSDPEVRKAAIQAVVDLQFRAAAEALIGCLDDEDASVKRTALNAIAELKLHEYAPTIAAAIPDPDPRTNHAAISALESIPDIDVLTARAIELVVSKDTRTSGTGANILMNHPTPAAEDALIEALKDDRDQYSATIALGRIGSRKAVPRLIGILGGPNWSWWIYTAADLLSDLGDPSAAPAIRQAVGEGKLNKRYLEVAEELERQ